MASFGALDWTFIALTATISAFIGIYHGRKANGGGKIYYNKIKWGFKSGECKIIF